MKILNKIEDAFNVTGINYDPLINPNAKLQVLVKAINIISGTNYDGCVPIFNKGKWSIYNGVWETGSIVVFNYIFFTDKKSKEYYMNKFVNLFIEAYEYEINQ